MINQKKPPMAHKIDTSHAYTPAVATDIRKTIERHLMLQQLEADVRAKKPHLVLPHKEIQS